MLELALNTSVGFLSIYSDQKILLDMELQKDEIQYRPTG